MRRRSLSIAVIVTIGLVAAATLGLGGLGAIGYNFFCDRQREEFHREHAILADQLATSLTLPLWNFDREQIGKVLESVAHDEDLQALIVQATGPMAASYARVRDGRWQLKPADRVSATEGLPTERRAIAVGGETIGQVQIFATTRFLEARLGRAKYGVMGTIFALDLLLIVALYLLLWRTVLRPLREVEHYAVAISTGGAPGEPGPGRRYFGELESVRSAMQKMVTMLEARFAQTQKSEARYRLLAENISDVIWTMDFTGQVTYVSPSVERLVGYTFAEVLQRQAGNLLTPESEEKLRAIVARAAAAAARGEPIEPGRIELENVHRSGRSVWAENNYECLLGPDGKPAGLLGVSRDITERKAVEVERARAVRREQEARKEFTRKLIASQEAERRRIASELHDSLGQNLLLIKNRAQLAQAQVGGAPEMNQQLDGITTLAAQAIAEVRQISHDLRPYQLDQLGLTRALQALIDNAAQSTAIQFLRKLDPVDDLFPGDAATELYRVVQESLNNILKHSGATQVRIDLERDVAHVELRVEDNGRGMEPRGDGQPAVTGFGLQNLAERVGILGGKLAINSKPGAGTRIEVTIPIREAG